MIYPANLNLAITSVARTLSSSAGKRGEVVSKIASASSLEGARADMGAVKVAMKFKSSGLMMDAMQSNMTGALSYLAAQEQSLKQVTAYLDRMGELVTGMSDPTKTSVDQENLLQEFNQLRSALVDETSAKFNGLDLYYSQGDAPLYNVQLSANDQSGMNVLPADLSQQAGWVALLGFAPPFNGLEGISDTPANILDPNILGGASFFAGLAETVSSLLSINVSQQSQLGFALDHAHENAVATKNAADKLTDIDVAREVTHLNKTDILIKSGAAMFTQANVAAESVLKLYGI
jgi:flagellin-like hook-associated protein FlgL